MQQKLRRRAEAALGLAVAAAIVWGAVWGFGLGRDDPGRAAGTEGYTPVIPFGQLRTRTAPLTGAPVFHDEFDGAAGSPASPANWRSSVAGNGFGNGELECTVDDRYRSALDGQGNLVITADRARNFICPDGSVVNYVSARLTGEGLAPQLYGHIRVNAKLPTAPGMWPAIWALGTDNARVGWPASGEMDIAEVVGSQPKTVFQTLHGPAPRAAGDAAKPDSPGSSAGAKAYELQRATRLPVLPSDGFHVYGVDWTPTSVTFSVDDRVTGTFTKAQVSEHGTWVFDKPFFLLLDLAVGGSFPGPPTDATVFPQRMVVDYVRVYR